MCHSWSVTDDGLFHWRRKFRVYSGASDQAQYPQGGASAFMEAQSSGASVKIVLIPIRYDFDGTGRLPSTTPEQIERYRQGCSNYSRHLN